MKIEFIEEPLLQFGYEQSLEYPSPETPEGCDTRSRTGKGSGQHRRPAAAAPDLRAGRRQDVASLRGRDWIAWLNASSGKTLFDDEAAALIDQLPYATPTSLAVLRDEPRTQKLLDASQTWVREHRAAV